MELKRFEEELEVLRTEMTGYLHFYKDGVLTSLNTQREELHGLLIDGEREGTTSRERELGQRYATVSNDEQIIKGKIGLTMEGIQFAMDQIAAGITAFAPVLSGELDAFREVLLIHQMEGNEEEIADEEGDEEGVDGLDDVEDFVEDSEPLDMSEERNKTGDVILDALAGIPVEPTDPISSVEIGSATSCWRLPNGISQGHFNGRNGSSACSIIAFLMAYTISKISIEIPVHPVHLQRNIVHMICRCMELGNRVYDMFRDSLPMELDLTASAWRKLYKINRPRIE